MPGYMLHQGAIVQCAHAGDAQPIVVNPRVTVSAQAIVTLASPYAITRCTFPAMTGGNSPPCATAQFTTSATRVTAMGQPVLLVDSQATCIPTGTPLMIALTQSRVTAI